MKRDLIALAIVAGALAASHWQAHRMGAESVRVEWRAETLARTAAENEALQIRFRENERIYREQSEHASQEKKRHDEEIQAIRRRHDADLSRRVPIDPAAFGCRPAAGTEAAAPGSDGQTDAGEASLPEPFAGDLRQLVTEAEEVAADLRTLKARAEGCFAGRGEDTK